MQITTGFIYELVPLLSKIGSQEMDLQQAEVVAQAIEGVTKHLNELEPRRKELMAKEFIEGEREAAFEQFSKEKVEIPDVNFKNLPGLRLTPNDVLLLKGAGLYAEATER